MSQPKLLTETFDAVLKPAGFKRKSDTWYSSRHDTVLILNLQKSTFGQQYYVNLGVWLKALGENETPKENHCHVRCRWKATMPDVDAAELERLLDLADGSMSAAERVSRISELLNGHVLPFFAQVASLDGLRTALGSKSCRIHYVTRTAKELLGGRS